MTDAAISARLAHHIASLRYEDLSAQTVASTKRALLDGIGVMLAASGVSADIRPFVELAWRAVCAEGASILGSWERVTASSAALANGAMAHALDFEDAFDAAPTHPNASLIPAALAIAQTNPEISGRDFIAAMAIGCDLSCRLALSAGPALQDSPWYPPPILGAFGAVATTARLLRLNETQVNDAFSLLLCQNACPGEIKHSEHTVIRAVREAFPAQAAVVSAQLALSGVRGFDAPFEGRGGFFRLFAQGRFNADSLFADLGRRFYIDELSFKPWPCCRGTHPYIEAAQQLRARHSIQWQQIKSIRAAIGPVQRMLSEPLERKRAPSTAIDAKFSIPFTLATAFIEPEVTLDCFTAEKLGQSDVLALARRISFVQEQDMSPTTGALDVELDDGRRFELKISQLLGSPNRPLDDRRLQAKFIDCAMRAARAFSDAEAEALCKRVMTIESATSFAAALAFPSS